jgi:hypothetical protein
MSDLPEWAQSLPEELHGAPHLSGSENVEQWVGHLKNDSAWRGQSIRVPSEGADESVMAQFHEQLREKVPSLMPTPMDDDSASVVYEQMGKPKDAKGYQIPEGVELANPEEYMAAAHALDMTQKVFSRWVEMEAAGKSDQNAAIAQAMEEGYTALKSEWGAAFDERYARVGDVLQDAPESIREAYKNQSIPADQVKWLHSLADLASENVEASNQESARMMTPEQAALELEEFKPKWYAMKKHDPGYKAAQAKVERLMKLRMGQPA